jgi:hypothetical protein
MNPLDVLLVIGLIMAGCFWTVITFSAGFKMSEILDEAFDRQWLSFMGYLLTLPIVGGIPFFVYSFFD